MMWFVQWPGGPSRFAGSQRWLPRRVPAGWTEDSSSNISRDRTHRPPAASMLDDPMHEPKPPDDPDSPLAFSMEGYQGQPPSPLINRYWAPGWNSVQSLNKFQSEVGGPLYEENPGIKLIEPSDPSVPRYFTAVPESFRPREGSWSILPLWRIFGSEELSAEAQSLAERIPTASLALHPDDARKLAVQAGGLVQVTVAGRPSRLP